MALNPWAVKEEPTKSAYKYLTHLGCKERDPKAIVAFLRTLDCGKLLEAQQKLLTPQVRTIVVIRRKNAIAIYSKLENEIIGIENNTCDLLQK